MYSITWHDVDSDPQSLLSFTFISSVLFSWDTGTVLVTSVLELFPLTQLLTSDLHSYGSLQS